MVNEKVDSVSLLIAFSLCLSLPFVLRGSDGRQMEEDSSQPKSSFLCSQSAPFSWRKIAPVGEEFTVFMPPQVAVEIKPDIAVPTRVNRSYNSTTSSAYYSITSREFEAAGLTSSQRLDLLARAEKDLITRELNNNRGSSGSIVYVRDLSLNGNSGRQFQLTLGEMQGTLQFYVTPRRAYKLVVMGANFDPGEANQFLNSFRLGGLNANLELDGMIAKPQGNGLGAGIGEGNGTSRLERDVYIRTDGGARERVYTGREVTSKIQITFKPEPEYTLQARSHQISGTIVLRMVFLRSGRVSNIGVVKGLPYGLNEKAIEAARQIRFRPATKDGHPVSQLMQLDFNFNLE
jgi:TonB family protein